MESGCIDPHFLDLGVNTRVEAGTNTSTVPLRIVGGDEMGSLKSDTVQLWSKGLGPENDYAGEWKHLIQKTDPSSRQRGCTSKTSP
jgi:hypothetical protein